MGMQGRVEIAVDLDRCQGHGRCYTTAPGLFAPVDDYGRAGLLIDGEVDPGSDPATLARRAADGCPERAISLRQEGV